MADIQADAQDVMTLLSQRVAELESEKAVLLARLHNAAKQIDDLTNTSGDAEQGTSEKTSEKATTRRR